jgi:lipopolysaccharide transport system permease protein
MLNPLVPVFESLRLGLLGVGTVSAWQLTVSALMLTALLVIGMLLFTRVERTFMDTV